MYNPQNPDLPLSISVYLDYLLMKKIRLDICEYRGKYRVYVGPGTYFEFRSKKKCQRFLATYRVLVTDYARLLRSLQGTTYDLYSLYYFELPDHIEYKIKKTLQEFDNRFAYVFKDFTKGNHNHFVMHDLQTCFDYLEQTLMKLKKFAQKNKHYSLTNQASALLLGLENYKTSFESSLKDYNPSTRHRTKVIQFSVVKDKIKVK